VVSSGGKEPVSPCISEEAVRRNCMGRRRTEVCLVVPDWRNKQTCILGCGNVLFGDDGFGPAVARYCQEHCEISSGVCIMDVGTSVRNILFDIMLSDERPSTIVIVDAMDCGCEPGDLFEPDIDSIPAAKADDFSMHQVPTSNMLCELRDLCGVEVRVLACQVAHIPPEVCPGLSDPVAMAVEQAAKILESEHLL
jgi:coenzyme F420 hydrogenase subunit delta